MALLEVKDLQLSIGKAEILRDIDLTVDAGEILGVIGESGSGKSMTALSVMQLLPTGAVANMLWWRILNEEGQPMGLRRYVTLVAPIAVPAVLAAICVLVAERVLVG
jgi:ABC-type multidrug transport system ATPase subunit